MVGKRRTIYVVDEINKLDGGEGVQRPETGANKDKVDDNSRKANTVNVCWEIEIFWRWMHGCLGVSLSYE